ncbi:MAG: GAF domain-containing protein [Proteobacteria bacterium]|nr:GAF domain-containing protein [Pseudomonadota bacterium]
MAARREAAHTGILAVRGTAMGMASIRSINHGGAVREAMPNSQMAKRLARLEAVQAVVLDIGRRAAHCKDLREFYRTVHAAVARLMSARSFFIALYDAPANGIRFAYRVDEKDDIPDPDTLFPLQPSHVSPTSMVIRSGKPLVIAREEILARNTQGRSWGAGAPAEHWIGMPLIGHDEAVFGAIVVQSYAPGFRYSEEDIALFGLMSEHVAEAVEHAQFAVRLERAIAERTERLESEIAERRHAEKLQRALYEISALSVKDIGLDAFYAGLHAVMGELMYARNFAVVLYEPTSGMVSFPYYADENDAKPPAEYRRPAGDGLTGFVMKTRAPQSVDQARFKELHAAGELVNVIGSLDFHVWMGAPLVYQDTMLGVVALQSYDPAIGYGEHDLKLLSFVADHIAAALSRKQADDALRAAHARMEAGRAKLQSTNDELRKTLTDLGLAQDELIRQEKLAGLGALVAGIAHEVNTPLGICVTAVSHLVEETLGIRRKLDEGGVSAADLGAHFDAVEEVLRILTSNTQRASGLIRSFKQVAVDQSSEDVREFALAEYIEDTLKSLRPKLKSTRHAIAVDCDPSLRVRSMPGALSQILTNLVINSLVHGFEGVPEGRIAIHARIDADALAIDYRDNGCGMDAESLKRLFDPFYTTKRGRGGSGLGANIVYNLVTRRLGGTIAADSVPGNGLHYAIRLPLTGPRDAVGH